MVYMTLNGIAEYNLLYSNPKSILDLPYLLVGEEKDIFHWKGGGGMLFSLARQAGKTGAQEHTKITII